MTDRGIELEKVLNKGKSHGKQIKEIVNKSTAFHRQMIKNVMGLQFALVIRLLHSALVDADRLDAATWQEQDNTGSTETFLERENIIRKWGLYRDKLQKNMSKFQDTSINEARKNIAQAAKDFSAKPQGIYRFSAPTGSGKNLSSLGFALQVAQTHKKNRIFFIAPYLTILEQNARAVRENLGLTEDDSFLLEHHSNFDFSTIEEGEGVSTYELAIERWDSNIIFSSMVQFLNAGFSSHGSRRLQGLVNSVIILDEIQSIPLHCTYFFHGLIHFLKEVCGCIILLSTATPLSFPDDYYQILYSQPTELVPMPKTQKEVFRRTQFHVEEDSFDDERLSEFMLEKQREFGSVLLIVNTKATALAVLRRVEEKVKMQNNPIPTYYLTTELCPAHRRKLMEDMKAYLDEEKPLLCISTSLIESGVDVSFPTVIRTMAGLDSLIQSAGRCNRHGKNGKNKMAPVFVLWSSSEKLASLPDIQRGREIVRGLISKLPTEQSLDSDYALELYFKSYFFGKESLAIINNPIFAQYGSNPTGCMAFKEKNKGETFPDFFPQAFQTAGRHFAPIVDDTVGVVVPYGEVGKLCEEWGRSKTYKEKREIRRRLQGYSVNVYQGKLDQLRKAGLVYFDTALELWRGEKDSYKEKTGLAISTHRSVDDFIL